MCNPCVRTFCYLCVRSIHKDGFTTCLWGYTPCRRGPDGTKLLESKNYTPCNSDTVAMCILRQLLPAWLSTIAPALFYLRPSMDVIVSSEAATPGHPLDRPTPVSPCLSYGLVWRASLGAVPVQLLNARENELGSEKPSSRDISVRVRLLSRI
jgi:hypothetical protein